MAYKIIDIQGIGEAYAPKLIAIGIKTPDELLEACLTPAARKKVADKTGISGKLILKWANHADLFRISGIGPQYAELLEAVGVDTVKELRHRVPANLTAKMVEINKAKNQRGKTKKTFFLFLYYLSPLNYSYKVSSSASHMRYPTPSSFTI